MARPKTPLAERVARKVHRDGNHLIWNGPMYKGRPILPHYGNPARILLGLQHQPRISIKPACSEPRCVDPFHWKVIRERSWKYDLPPPPWVDPRIDLSEFSEREQKDILRWLELLSTGEAHIQELDEDEELSQGAKKEILKHATR